MKSAEGVTDWGHLVDLLLDTAGLNASCDLHNITLLIPLVLDDGFDAAHIGARL